MNEPLSKRELLAGVAMLYIGHNFPQLEPSDIAARAVERTDALLAELERTAPKPEMHQDLLETPWTCTKCGKETRNKHGYCDSCVGVKTPDSDGWIPHRPGDPMPCDGSLMVTIRTRDFDEETDIAREWDWRTLTTTEAEIIAWKPA